MNCLRFLDTSLISHNLLEKLIKLGYLNSANYLLKNSIQFELGVKRKVGNMLGKYE